MDPAGGRPVHQRSHASSRRLPAGLRILHEDRDVLVVEKPPGLLTVGTETEKSRTLYSILMDYVRKGCAKSRRRIFIVHRLDRETSGVLVFAKSGEAKLFLQSHWGDTKKKYLAVVHGRCEKRSGIISTYLAENRAHVVYSTSDPGEGKLAETAYRVLKQTRDYALLEIDLLTGRKNQIRVHLADLGHPVVGDKKYGKGATVHKRLALHALSLSFIHPFNGRRLTFEAPMPAYYAKLVGRDGEQCSDKTGIMCIAAS
jgi:RluA family pseudouridine synthase